MNILLVDDQPNIISSLVSCIPWHSLGISSIYTATSAAAAREILLSHSADILITDIEMPHEDGLSLISWMRENDFNPECILLTSCRLLLCQACHQSPSGGLHHSACQRRRYHQSRKERRCPIERTNGKGVSAPLQQL